MEFFPHLVQNLFYLYPESYLWVKAECQILYEGTLIDLLQLACWLDPGQILPLQTLAYKSRHTAEVAVWLCSLWPVWGFAGVSGVPVSAEVALLCCREEEKRGGVAWRSEAAAGRAQRRAPPVLLQHPPAQHQGHEHAKVSVGSPSARSDTDTQLVLSQPCQHHGCSKCGGLVLLRFFPG